jgi:predicted DNA-binding transcriptional regulator AlpA
VSETLTIYQIAELMHVSPKTARDKKVTAPDFPEPAFRLSQRNRAWRRSEVFAYLGITDEPRSAPLSLDNRS